MTKATNEDKEIEELRLTGNIGVKITAGNRFVNMMLTGAFMGIELNFYPDEAEHIARGLLKAIEHIQSLTPPSE